MANGNPFSDALKKIAEGFEVLNAQAREQASEPPPEGGLMAAAQEDPFRVLTDVGATVPLGGVSSTNRAIEALRTIAKNPKGFMSPADAGPFRTVIDELPAGLGTPREFVGRIPKAGRPQTVKTFGGRKRTVHSNPSLGGPKPTVLAAKEEAAREVLRESMGADLVAMVDDGLFLARRPKGALRRFAPSRDPKQEFILVGESPQGKPVILEAGEDMELLLGDAVEEGLLEANTLNRFFERLSQKGAI